MNILQLLAQDGASIRRRMMEARVQTRRREREARRWRVAAALAQGANAHARDEEGNTALMYAVGSGDAALVQQLLLSGAEVNGANERGMMPLMYAAMLDAPEVVRALLAAGADGAADMAELLFLALHAGREDEVMALLAAGAPVNARRHLRVRWKHDDYSVIEYALLCRASSRGIRALLEAGALLTPRILPLAIDSENRLETIEMLLEAGADVNGRDGKLRTALMHAAISGDNIRVFRALRAAGADVHARDEDDNTVLHHMLGNLHPNTCVWSLLLRAGADMHAANNRGVSPLMLAAKSEDPRLRAYLGAKK